jgi:hypothetical protein
MKRLTLIACLAVLAACASGGSNTKIIQPDVEMYQLVGPADLNYPGGAIEVQFALRIANRSGEAIKLRQVEMTPVGAGGPYVITRRTYYFNQEIAPNQFKDVSFWARASAEGDAFAMDANAPVNVRAVATFESPSGGFRKILMKTFSQQGTGPREGQ